MHKLGIVVVRTCFLKLIGPLRVHRSNVVNKSHVFGAILDMNETLGLEGVQTLLNKIET